MARFKEKLPGYTDQVNLWMRPAVKRLLKRISLERDSTVQATVESLICDEARRHNLPVPTTSDDVVAPVVSSHS